MSDMFEVTGRCVGINGSARCCRWQGHPGDCRFSGAFEYQPARETQPGDARHLATVALELTTGAPGRDVEALAEQVRRAAPAVLALPPGDAPTTREQVIGKILEAATVLTQNGLAKVEDILDFEKLVRAALPPTGDAVEALLTFRKVVTHSDEETRREAERLVAMWRRAPVGDVGTLLQAVLKAREIAFDWLHHDPDYLPPGDSPMTRVHDAKAGWTAMKKIYDGLTAALATWTGEERT